MIGSALSDLLPHAHEKSRSLAGSDGLRSSDELAILTPRVRHCVLPGQRSAVIYRALDLFVRACHEDPKPQKTASERDFSCAAKPARGRTGAVRALPRLQGAGRGRRFVRRRLAKGRSAMFRAFRTATVQALPSLQGVGRRRFARLKRQCASPCSTARALPVRTGGCARSLARNARGRRLRK